MAAMEQISRSRRKRPGTWSRAALPGDPLLIDTAAIAAAITDSERVMLVLAQPASRPGAAILRFATGFDRMPPALGGILELHRNAGLDVVVRPSLQWDSWAGFGYCGVGLGDDAGAAFGVLCVLLAHAPVGQPDGQPGEPALSARRMVAFEALGRRLSARHGEWSLPAVAGRSRRGDRKPVPSGVAGVMPRILVVDDEAVVRMLVVDLLRERGYAVREAEDAASAMAYLHDGEVFDLLVTDIGLPGGFDGSTLARRARALHPGLPVLFITGYAFGTDGDVTLEPGIPVLTKPFTLAALSAKIGELLAVAHT